ncbi:hypothetical protein [Hyphobacterium sp.]|uniref:hypothetical protein n=1 Tax=Hyphobacterium sp. TaxID=2004662 RepID=UPI003B5271B0
MKNICLTSVFALNAALAAPAMAQSTDPIDDILVCQQIAEEAARLACFDAAAARLSGERDNGLVTVYREDIEAVERDSFGFDLPSMPGLSLSLFRGGSNSPDPLDPGTTPERMASAETSDTNPPEARANLNTRNDNPEPDVAIAGNENEDQGGGVFSRMPRLGLFGGGSETNTRPADSEPINGVQVVERDQEGGVERIVMEIERIREVAYGRHRFYMTNGQVWVQSGTDRFRYNDDGELFAEIRRAAMDSYFLQINGTGRALRVRRER